MADTELKAIENHIAQDVSVRDQYRLQKSLARIKRRLAGKQPVSRDLEKLSTSLKTSLAWVANRRKKIPEIKYPDLPIASESGRIKKLLSENQVIVVAGETGSGKTTQLPKICLELGLGTRGLVGHTQPRRVAARSVAARIAEELGTSLGALIGYQVRFTDQSSPNTLVKLMTDGILLSEIQRDPYLRNYECIIIDEAHERSINIDFLLGYLKQLLPKRPDLKLIITSATIDVERFSEHFNSAPVVEVSGRTYPVEVFYRPWEDEYDTPVDAVVGQVKNILETEPLSQEAGDILVFCTGERDIRQLALALRRAQLKNLDVLPLYSRLSIAEQDRVFRPGRGRRVVLATNVAETSLTVPGIGFVIDTGTARISRYSVRTKVQRLPIEPISQASANQRAGRCGRIAEGVCIRLYSEQDFLSRDEFTPPEIMRTNLAAVILQMQNLKLGDITDFPFIERPQDKQIRDGLRLLEELSLVDENDRITSLGRLLSGLPVDPRFARILWQAQHDQCLTEAITIISLLSIQDPRERPADKQQQADEKHRVFMDRESDFNAILNLWNSYQEQRQALSNRKLDDWCRKHFLSPLRMREWREVHFQLSLMSRELGWKLNKTPPGYKSLHRALLSGLITQIGVQQENKEFLGTRNRRFRIFPGSWLAKKPPKWVFAAQMLDTGQLFAHQVAKLNPEWLLGLADHALQTDYYEPYYHARRGEIMARMRYSLFGLVVSDQHKVSYKSIEPELCHELFIREALANWKYRGKGKFYQNNRQVCDRLQELEDRTRTGELVVDEQQLFEFYADKIPAEVIDLASFESWRERAEKKNPRILNLDEESLTESVDQEKLIEFPDSLDWQGLSFRLSYKFQPGSEEDGVTLHVPVGQLHQVPEHLVEWLVPGLLKDKLVAVLKSLPKRYRRELVPIPAHVDKLWPAMTPGDQPLQEALAYQLKRSTGKAFPEEAWKDVSLDDFYLMRFQLEDDQGRSLATSRNLRELRDAYRSQAQQAISEIRDKVEDFPDATDWEFGELPESVDIQKGKEQVRLWPALQDKQERVGYRLLDNHDEARHIHARGVQRLFLLVQSDARKYLQKELFKASDLRLMALLNPLPDIKIQLAELKEDLLIAVAGDLLPDAAKIRSRDDFLKTVEHHRGELVRRSLELETLCLDWADQLRIIKSEIAELSVGYEKSVEDIHFQIGELFSKDFLQAMPAEWRPHTGRFLKGISKRIDRMQGQLARDLEMVDEITDLYGRYQQLIKEIPVHRAGESSELIELRWMLEEYRISLFSQPIKTSRPVSRKRLENLFEQAERATATLREQ